MNIVELRQYTLRPGQRDVLIDLFDREFVESQEALGITVIGQFRDRDNPDRFVWLRGFEDMPSRERALRAFYLEGRAWKDHRAQANATMLDSDNVLLLRPARPDSGFPTSVAGRQTGPASRPDSLVVATLYYSNSVVDDDFVRFFEQQIVPVMKAAGAPPLAYLQTEARENTFPQLPVRTGENVFVWLASFANLVDHRKHLDRLHRSTSWTEQVSPELTARTRTSEHLVLQPTARSLLR